MYVGQRNAFTVYDNSEIIRYFRKVANTVVVRNGKWQDMNEPANFGTNEERPWNWPEEHRPYWTLKCPVGTYDDPPYRTSESFSHTAANRGIFLN